MARHDGPVLFDNNAIGAAVDAGCWKALAGGYHLETVAEVAREAGSYFRKLSDGTALQVAFNEKVTLHEVTPAEQADLLANVEGIALDDGEKDLWAHAQSRQDKRILCGPDKASMRTALRLGLRDRVVSLETLLKDIGISTKNLPRQYTQGWLEQTFTELAFLEADRD